MKDGIRVDRQNFEGAFQGINQGERVAHSCGGGETDERIWLTGVFLEKVEMFPPRAAEAGADLPGGVSVSSPLPDDFMGRSLEVRGNVSTVRNNPKCR